LIQETDVDPEDAGNDGDLSLAAAAKALDEGHIDKALAIYRPLVSGGGGDELSALVGLAVSHARRKEWSEAEDCLLRVLKRVPDAGQVRAYLASVRLEQGRVDDAQADMDAALEMAPGSALVRLKHAEMLLRLGVLQDAYTELQRAAKLNPPDDATLEYIRGLLVTTKKALSQSIDRRGASPAEFWRALVARFQGNRPVAAGRRTS
jgi:predicted Zn-dependent protease